MTSELNHSDSAFVATSAKEAALAKGGKFILYSIIVAFLGFLDAAYLTILHYQETIPPCTVGSCEAVLTSQFSTILGIPLALFGSGFYLSIIILCLLLLTSFKKVFLISYYTLAVWGFVFSLFLLGVQALVLNAFCQYCLISVATSTGIFILAVLNFWKGKKPLRSTKR